MFALGAPAATDSLLCYVLMSKSGGNIALPPAKPERDQIIAASFPVFVTAPSRTIVPRSCAHA